MTISLISFKDDCIDMTHVCYHIRPSEITLKSVQTLLKKVMICGFFFLTHASAVY